MEPEVRIEVLHRVIGAAPGSPLGGSNHFTADDVAKSASPFVDINAARLDVVENQIMTLTLLVQQAIERMDGTRNQIRQIADKLSDLDSTVQRHQTILRDMILTPRTRSSSQRTGYGPR